jgi:hypothetical protein
VWKTAPFQLNDLRPGWKTGAPAKMTWRRPIARQLIAAWLSDCCVQDKCEWERAGALYDNWRAYAHARGAEPGSPADFAEEMERHGLTVDRVPPVSRGRIRWGLRLR